MELSTLDEYWRRRLPLERDIQGVLVTGMSRGSPADRGGLKLRDNISQIAPARSSGGGLRIASLTDLAEAKERLARERELKVSVYRYGRRRGWLSRETKITAR